MQIVVVTGINGSGKSTALRALEDLGYYAIDNLPIALLDRLIELFMVNHSEIEKIALVADTRGAHNLEQVPFALNAADQAGHRVEVLYMDSSDEIVARRYSETRRRHPLAVGNETVNEAIARDRELLAPVSAVATRTIDTTGMSVHDTKKRIREMFRGNDVAGAGLNIRVMSFGFKKGVPPEADLVFDVRFLPNPYFVEGLRALTGRDPECAGYVLERAETQQFLAKLTDLLDFLVPQYEAEGKSYLTIAIGCTGGRHRSVAIAERLGQRFRELGREVGVRHRDTPMRPRVPSFLPPDRSDPTT